MEQTLVGILEKIFEQLKKGTEVLEQIRDNLKERKPGESDPFEKLVERIDENKPRVNTWRSYFAQCRDRFGNTIASTFNGRSDIGEFPTITIDPKELETAFQQREESRRPFDREDFDQFSGMWTGILRGYDLSTGEETDATTQYLVWDKTSEMHGTYVQKVVGSETRHFQTKSLPDLSENKVDLVVDLYRDDIGITAWASNYQHGRQEIPLIGYKLDQHKFLWINQMMTEEMKPIFGENVFGVALEWRGTFEGKQCYFLVPFLFEIDFEACNAKLFGDKFWKARYEQVV
jgi:hypothetical protein